MTSFIFSHFSIIASPDLSGRCNLNQPLMGGMERARDNN
jgi:hypothetical protein